MDRQSTIPSASTCRPRARRQPACPVYAIDYRPTPRHRQQARQRQEQAGEPYDSQIRPRLLRQDRLPGVCLPDEIRTAPEPAPVLTEQGDEFLGVTGPDEHLDVGRCGFPLECLEHDVEVVDGYLLGAR